MELLDTPSSLSVLSPPLATGVKMVGEMLVNERDR